jgi:hypothetical protein
MIDSSPGKRKAWRLFATLTATLLALVSPGVYV